MLKSKKLDILTPKQRLTIALEIIQSLNKEDLDLVFGNKRQSRSEAYRHFAKEMKEVISE